MERRTELPAAGLNWSTAPPDYGVGVYQTMHWTEPAPSAAPKVLYESPPTSTRSPRSPSPLSPPQDSTQQLPTVSKLPNKNPGYIWCSHCKKTVISGVRYKRGSFSWIICGVTAVFMFWPCSLFALCLKTFKDVEHSCPDCQRVLHVYKRP